MSVACPRQLADVDLFGPGAQEHWYEAYPILHREAPVLVLPGGGPSGIGDAFVLTCYTDIERVVKDPLRFTPVMSQRLCARLDGMAYASGNTFEHQPGIMLGTLALTLRFARSSKKL